MNLSGGGKAGLLVHEVHRLA